MQIRHVLQHFGIFSTTKLFELVHRQSEHGMEWNLNSAFSGMQGTLKRQLLATQSMPLSVQPHLDDQNGTQQRKFIRLIKGDCTPFGMTG